MTVDVSPKPPVEEVYLGDGLYASFDGFMVKLRAPRLEGDHEVFLEQQVYLGLRAFAARVWELKL